MEAGKPSGLTPTGLGARDTLRLEACMALYGNDIDDTTTVLEADLVVSLPKLKTHHWVGLTAAMKNLYGALPGLETDCQNESWAEFLPRIFEKFFRVPGQEHTSSGLGLTIAKETVEAHGGAIEATSRPGKGTKFTFTVKAVEDPGRSLI